MDYQTYMTAWTNNVFWLAYETWREAYEKSDGIEYRISFDKEYGSARTELLELMCVELRLQTENAGSKEKRWRKRKTIMMFMLFRRGIACGK